MNFSPLLELNKFHNNNTPQEETRKHSSEYGNPKRKPVTFNFLGNEPSHVTRHYTHTELQTERRTSNSIQHCLKIKHPTARKDVYRVSCVHL